MADTAQPSLSLGPQAGPNQAQQADPRTRTLRPRTGTRLTEDKELFGAASPDAGEKGDNDTRQRGMTVWGTSKYRGVSVQRQSNSWTAFVRACHKTVYLGIFKREEDAAAVYDAASYLVYGKDAKLNHPDRYMTLTQKEGKALALSTLGPDRISKLETTTGLTFPKLPGTSAGIKSEPIPDTTTIDPTPHDDMTPLTEDYNTPLSPMGADIDDGVAGYDQGGVDDGTAGPDHESTPRLAEGTTKDMDQGAAGTSSSPGKRPRVWKRGTNKYRGVCWDKSIGKWKAQVQPSSGCISLGVWDTEERAAEAYDAGAYLLWGKDTEFNFPGRLAYLTAEEGEAYALDNLGQKRVEKIKSVLASTGPQRAILTTRRREPAQANTGTHAADNTAAHGVDDPPELQPAVLDDKADLSPLDDPHDNTHDNNHDNNLHGIQDSTYDMDVVLDPSDPGHMDEAQAAAGDPAYTPGQYDDTDGAMHGDVDMHGDMQYDGSGEGGDVQQEEGEPDGEGGQDTGQPRLHSRARRGTNKYRGVCWDTRNLKYKAQLQIKATKLNLGSSLSEEDAAQAFDAAVYIVWGRAAPLNFPDTYMHLTPKEGYELAAKTLGPEKLARLESTLESSRRKRQAHKDLLPPQDSKRTRASPAPSASGLKTETAAGPSRQTGPQGLQGKGRPAAKPGPSAKPPEARSKVSRGANKYRGVTWDMYSSKHKVQLQIRRSKVCLGSFDSDKEAAAAYDAAVYLVHGRKAPLNFPDSYLSLAPEEGEALAAEVLGPAKLAMVRAAMEGGTPGTYVLDPAAAPTYNARLSPAPDPYKPAAQQLLTDSAHADLADPGSAAAAAATAAGPASRSLRPRTGPRLTQMPEVNGQVVKKARESTPPVDGSAMQDAMGSEEISLERAHSQCMGVEWDEEAGQWTARFWSDLGTPVQLGYHATEEEAALAYDAAAYLVHGRHVELNFPDVFPYLTKEEAETLATSMLGPDVLAEVLNLEQADTVLAETLVELAAQEGEADAAALADGHAVAAADGTGYAHADHVVMYDQGVAGDAAGPSNPGNGVPAVAEPQPVKRLLSKRLGKRHLGKKTKGSSQYWGVCKHKRNGGVWVSNVWATVRQVSLGQFEEEEEAALAYDAASYILYGKSAKLNFPDIMPNLTIEEGEALALSVLGAEKLEKLKEMTMAPPQPIGAVLGPRHPITAPNPATRNTHPANHTSQLQGSTGVGNASGLGALASGHGTRVGGHAAGAQVSTEPEPLAIQVPVSAVRGATPPAQDAAPAAGNDSNTGSCQGRTSPGAEAGPSGGPVAQAGSSGGAGLGPVPGPAAQASRNGSPHPTPHAAPSHTHSPAPGVPALAGPSVTPSPEPAPRSDDLSTNTSQQVTPKGDGPSHAVPLTGQQASADESSDGDEDDTARESSPETSYYSVEVPQDSPARGPVGGGGTGGGADGQQGDAEAAQGDVTSPTSLLQQLFKPVPK